MSQKQPELTKAQKEFIDQTMAHRRAKVEELAYKVLALSLKADIPVFDLPYYILMRSKTILDEAFHKINFNNPKLVEARKHFLKECLVQMKDSIEIPERKEEKDETDVRDNRCEPIAQAAASMMLDPELVFSDENYFDQVLTEDEGVPLYASIFGYSNSLEEKMTMIIGEHWRLAGKKHWGCEKEYVKFSQLDKVLKQK